MQACLCASVCVLYLSVAGEAGSHYSRQQLAVYGGGWDDLSRGHGRDALQSFLLGILVLHANTDINTIIIVGVHRTLDSMAA